MQETVKQKITEAKRGEQKAFSFLLDLYWDAVFRFQLKRTYDENDAEDITIQTFSKAFDKIDSFDENYNFKTWLISISKNIHIDMLRYRKNKPIYTPNDNQKEMKMVADESPTVEDSLITEQNLNRLLFCIKQMKEPYRTAIQLRYLQEKSYKEMTEIMDITMSNVKVTLLRAKKILAEIIIKN